MKVKDLLEEIKRCKKDYPDFLEWEIYTEQCTEGDKEYKREHQDWKIYKANVLDDYDWEYFECVGYWTKIPKKKIFTINVNY